MLSDALRMTFARAGRTALTVNGKGPSTVASAHLVPRASVCILAFCLNAPVKVCACVCGC